MRWKLICSLVIFVSSTELFALVMPNFEIDLEYRDFGQFYAIYQEDKKIALGIDAFIENYRAHMWTIRNVYTIKDQSTRKYNEVVDYENLRFYRTVYNLIPTELARATFGIKGGAVEYTNNSEDVLECVRDGCKSIEQYNRSHWNYILLVNLINTAVNSVGDVNFANFAEDKDITPIINSVYDRVKNAYKNKDKWNSNCDSLLKLAKEDIKKYASILLFGKYLSQMKEIKRALINIDERAANIIQEAKNSNTFDDDWVHIIDNDSLADVAAWLAIMTYLGGGAIHQYSGEYKHELSLSYLSRIWDGSLWDIEVGYRINSSMLEPCTYEYCSNQFISRISDDFMYICPSIQDKKYMTYRLIRNEDGRNEDGQGAELMRPKIRKAMKYIRRQAEEGCDVKKYKLIIMINNILNELPLMPDDDKPWEV